MQRMSRSMFLDKRLIQFDFKLRRQVHLAASFNDDFYLLLTFRLYINFNFSKMFISMLSLEL